MSFYNHLLIYLSTFFAHIYMYISIYLSIYLSVYPSIYLPPLFFHVLFEFRSLFWYSYHIFFFLFTIISLALHILFFFCCFVAQLTSTTIIAGKSSECLGWHFISHTTSPNAGCRMKLWTKKVGEGRTTRRELLCRKNCCRQ